jgi:uncharacterized membrane protein
MKILLGLHYFGIFMWMAGLITTLRLLILHPKESILVRPRFLYLESGFLRYTALPGICITGISGLFLLHYSVGFNLILYTPMQMIKLGLFMIMAVIHMLVIIQFRNFSQLSVDDQNEVTAFMIEHKALLLLTITVLIL